MVSLNPISTVSTSSLIGVGIACGGNILISLALTLQKLAHRRNEEAAQEKIHHTDNDEIEEIEQEGSEELNNRLFKRQKQKQKQKQNGNYETIPSPIPEEETPCPSPRPNSSSRRIQSSSHSLVGSNPEINIAEPLNAVPVVLLQQDHNKSENADSSVSDTNESGSGSGSRTLELQIPDQSNNQIYLDSPTSSKHYNNNAKDNHNPGDNNHPNEYNDNNDHHNDNDDDHQQQHQTENEHNGQVKEGEYLKSKLWWLGQILITIGEGGNFLSYGFAPASVVAPLGTVALIANCIFAPLILRERFHKRELFGMALAILGAITVVWSSNGSNPRLNPEQLITALKRIPFIIYTSITFTLLIGLIVLSNTSYGQRYLLVDIGVCTLFGGYTVLATKALSSLLSNNFFDSFNFTITWFLVAVVILTSLGQVRWLNRALMRFQSKEVIPTQFVFFSLAAIIGSAVLYEEFKDVTFSHFVNFAFGIGTTFLGVHLLTSTPSDSESDHEDTDSIYSNIRPSQPQRASSSASLNLLLPPSSSIISSSTERTPLIITSPKNTPLIPTTTIQRYNSNTGSGIGSTPTSLTNNNNNNKVRLVRIGSQNDFTPALGIGSQAGLLLLATTPPSSSGSREGPLSLRIRGRSSSNRTLMGIPSNTNTTDNNNYCGNDEERRIGNEAATSEREQNGRQKKRNTSASRGRNIRE
ncbi:uncharacterized protein L201_007595 [Kwoniella dendrophila CBS 6074]|uniref:DUF803-domain-containing protein n=1 Tax=Kwoniella dendrophila CBS 6074 TaxID=1295534 RepID=A0AAX4K4I1_9TREE